MKEENHDIVYMLWFMSLVNAYNWRDGANDHKKYTLWKKIYKEKKRAYELTEEKFPYIYRVAKKGAGRLAHTVAFLPSLGHPIKYDFYSAT